MFLATQQLRESCWCSSQHNNWGKAAGAPRNTTTGGKLLVFLATQRLGGKLLIFLATQQLGEAADVPRNTTTGGSYRCSSQHNNWGKAADVPRNTVTDDSCWFPF
jgi:hypothetical protein